MQLMVIQDSDRLKIGNLDAQVGMELANGYKIVKVNSKSAIAKRDNHTEKFFDPTSIFYTEAVNWGIAGKAGVDGRAEGLAAVVRKFNRGEEAYQKFQEYGYTLQLLDPIEEAGYNFAKEVEEKRQLAISNYLVGELKTTEGEDSKKFVLTFEVSTSTSDYKMFRTFETESENLARDEAVEMEWQLCSATTKVLFAKLEEFYEQPYSHWRYRPPQTTLSTRRMGIA